MKKEKEVFEEVEEKQESFIETYEDIINAFGDDVIKFTRSGEFDNMRLRMLNTCTHRKTCERCGKKAEKIFVKDLVFLNQKSLFPFDYTVLCPDCEPALVARLKALVE